MIETRIVLADDYAMVREGLKRIIDSNPGMSVVAEAADGLSALRKVEELSPDIVIVALSMEEVDGCHITREMRRRCSTTRVIALARQDEPQNLRDLLEAGASGYILKRARADELIEAIAAVAGGNIYIDPRVAGKLIHEGTHLHTKTELSPREFEVMRLLAEGFSNKEISGQLHISAKTVETYKSRSMEKLGLHSRVDLVRVAAERGWLPNRRHV